MLIRETNLVLSLGDITKVEVDAIVNAANSSLMGGGGVDGAIHRIGGPIILDECKQIRQLQGQCAPGNAVITSAGNLKAKYVIHTVGPIWRGGNNNETVILNNAYTNSLQLALQYEVKSIAFPSISTGAYGYPVDLAAQIALKAIKEFVCRENQIQEIRFVLFDQFTFDTYKACLSQLVST